MKGDRYLQASKMTKSTGILKSSSYAHSYITLLCSTEERKCKNDMSMNDVFVDRILLTKVLKTCLWIWFFVLTTDSLTDEVSVIWWSIPQYFCIILYLIWLMNCHLEKNSLENIYFWMHLVLWPLISCMNLNFGITGSYSWRALGAHTAPHRATKTCWG